MNLDQALQTFFVEGRELLADMEAALLHIGGAADEADTSESIGAVFRAAHTIKGSAGLFGLNGVVAFTHVVESALDAVRGGTLVLDPGLVALLLRCGDHIGLLLDAVEASPDATAPAPDAALDLAGAAMLTALRTHLGAADAPAATLDVATDAAAAAAGSDAARRWHIALRFGPSVLVNGMDPLSFVRYLSGLGCIERIVTLDDAVPTLDKLDPEACCLGFEIDFITTAGRAAIEGAFEFVIDDCTLHIEPADAGVGAPTLPAPAVAAPTAAAAATATAAPPTPAPDPMAARAKPAKDGKAAERQSVRVDADKLDGLIDLVGELIIAAAGAELVGRRTRTAELQECHSTLLHLVEQVRDSALQLRMVKIGATFARFKRVVHDVARDLGKDVELHVSGEDTELDKTVVEKIGDPLMHLVRNAMDHGIDAPELRLARGKPAQGTVALNAFHDSGSIVIEVSDDGSGLDRDRILAKGIERGLVEPGRSLSDSEVYGLVFEAGFSTAAAVTNLSGRGVGMDVVKRNIEALRGSVGISSRPGLGTTVTLRLPLTLSIISGLQVGVGRAVFVVPLDMVDECVAFSAEPGHDYTDLRGQVLPFIRLRQLFGIEGAPAAEQNIVVVQHAGQKFGLVVDRLMGEAQTVIKPLSKMFAQVQGISGSSILGSGGVALILDVPVLLSRIQSARTPELHG